LVPLAVWVPLVVVLAQMPSRVLSMSRELKSSSNKANRVLKQLHRVYLSYRVSHVVSGQTRARSLLCFVDVKF
jgi:hypothetical protein